MRKITSLILAILFTISLVTPISVIAQTTPTITIQSTSGAPGSTIDVDVTIRNNPGILGATLLFKYDSELTLTGATEGDSFSALTMTKPGQLTSPCRFTWDGQLLNSNEIKDEFSPCILQLTVMQKMVANIIFRYLMRAEIL